VGWGNHDYILDRDNDTQKIEVSQSLSQPAKKQTQRTLTEMAKKKAPQAFKGIDIYTLMKL
jgi:hypothetical protein